MDYTKLYDKILYKDIKLYLKHKFTYSIRFPDVKVRQFAADSLNKISTDDLIDFLPQMIQVFQIFSFPIHRDQEEKKERYLYT